jgi:hypothetical protein
MGEFVDTVGKAHMPMMRTVKSWYDYLKDPQSAQNKQAYGMVLGAFMHAENVAKGTTPWSRIRREWETNMPAEGNLLYPAFDHKSPEQMQVVFDNLMAQNNNDIKKVSASVRASLWSASPIKAMTDVPFPALARLEATNRDLTKMRDRANAHYLAFVNFTGEQWERWKHANADKYGFRVDAGPAAVEQIQEQQQVAYKGRDFGSSKVWRTMPDSFRAAVGRRPDSHWKPLGTAGNDPIITDDLINEINLLTSQQIRYLPKKSLTTVVKPGTMRPALVKQGMPAAGGIQ